MYPQIMQSIAEQIRRARTAQGLSQRALARMAGVSPPTIGNAEEGRPVTTETLEAIGAALGGLVFVLDTSASAHD